MFSSDLDLLLVEDLIDARQHGLLSAIYSRRLFSLHYELTTALYVGVLAFTSGTGILIYQNAGSLAHFFNNVALGAIMVACFWYAGKRRAPFTREEVASPTPYYSYVVLLGALLFLTIEGYLQNIYEIFGQQWGLAALVPAAFFFLVAYLFDHRGVLSLAIVLAASAVGLQVSVGEWYRSNVFSEEALILPAFVYSFCLIGIAFRLDSLEIKKHFTFSYLLWGAMILLTASLSALFQFQSKLLFLLIVGTGSIGAIVYARKTEAYVFFLMGVTSLYIGVTYMVARLGIQSVEFWFVYFLLSCVGLVLFITQSIRSLRSR